MAKDKDKAPESNTSVEGAEVGSGIIIPTPLLIGVERPVGILTGSKLTRRDN